MIKRGRWSAEDQRAVVPGTKVPPPKPPPELNDIERDIWASIVAKLPSNWFTGECQPLLKELVRHIRIADRLTRDLAKVEEALDKLTRESPEFEALTRDYHALLRAHGYQSERVGNLATKLRISPQAKILAVSAERKARDMPKGIDPWLDWGEPAAKN